MLSVSPETVLRNAGRIHLIGWEIPHFTGWPILKPRYGDFRFGISGTTTPYLRMPSLPITVL